MCNHNKSFKDPNNQLRCSNCFTELQEKPKTYKFWALLFIIGIALTSYTNVPVLKYYKELTLFEEKDVPLQRDSIIQELIRQDFQFPEVALAKILHETNNFKSRVCLEQKNLFGMGWNGETYYSYKTYRASIAHYHKWEQRYIKKHSLIYAEDSLYAFKLKKIK